MPPPPAGTARARPRRRVPGPPPAPRPPGRARLPRGNFGGTVARGRRGGGGERLPALPSLLPPRSPGALPGRSPPARPPRETRSHLSRLLATKTTLRSGPGNKWSGYCPLGTHSKIQGAKDWRIISSNGSTSGQPSAVNGAKDRGCHLCTFTECCLRLCSSWILCYVALSTTEVFIIVLISQVLHCPHALPFSHHLVLPCTSPKMPYFVPLHMQHGLSRTSFASLRDTSSSLKLQKPNSAVLTSEEMAFLVTADGYSFTFRGDLWEELQRLGCSPRQGTPGLCVAVITKYSFPDSLAICKALEH
ncbi:uncharacterized protein LOC123604216 [Leopardus geoffroyi]|uniref:uncharacterized protein LOC123604216 n=1 Tax=Leopardus geoffroyi TaxID=46844 RepID=UPI001E263353|nr:uncharacterized protein LOC123604216 [Leopardus geoffroyi]